MKDFYARSTVGVLLATLLALSAGAPVRAAVSHPMRLLLR
jgi:hypothetical protein